MLPKTNIVFVLLLALLALVVPKVGIEGDVDVPAKPVVVAGVAPKGDLLSPNILLLLAAVPNVRFVGFCVPKVLVVEAMPKVPLAGVVFVPNRGIDVVLSVEPNIVVVLPKADVVCDVPAFGVPNPSVVLFMLSKPEVIVPVETFPVMLNVDVVGTTCVVELNNGDVVLPNMPLAVPKDGESFVCPKIGVPLPNIEDVVVVGVKLALALANKLELIVLFDEDAVLVVVTKIEGTVVVGLLNMLVVPGTVDAVPKNDWLLLVEPKIFVLVVVFVVVAKMDVVDTPNCGTVIVGVLNCGVIVVVDTPNARTALFFIPLKLLILLAVVTGRTAVVDVVFEVLEVPKTNRGLLVDEVDVEVVVDVLSENAGALDNPVDVDVVNDVVFVIFVNGLFAVVVTKILDVKLKDLVVTWGNDVVWLKEFPKAFTFD